MGEFPKYLFEGAIPQLIAYPIKPEAPDAVSRLARNTS